MGKQLSFAVALNLITSGFTKGANQANGALRSIQLQVRNLSMAFAAGAIGIGNFTGQIMTSIKGMAKATQTLKNVTGDSYEYSKALKFVNEQSKRYNQELIGLTGNYARFYAAAKGSNMSLKDTQNVFDALTQSSTYFNLSADETSGVMLAVTQMMSKGKITAEELRGQLGERLPGAIQIMARALNVTTAQLDDMMKKGQLVASEVLPLFGQQLKIETMNFNPNSIEGSINKLRNTISELFATERMQKLMSGIINTITGAFEVIGNNIKNIWSGILAVIAAISANKISNIFSNIQTKVRNQVIEYERLAKRFTEVNDGAGRYKAPDVGNNLGKRIGWLKSNYDRYTVGSNDTVGDVANEIKARNKLKKEIDSLEKAYNRLNKAANSNIEGLVNQETQTNKLAKGWDKVKTSFSSFGTSIKSFIASNWITIVIAALTILISKISQAVNEAKRIKNIPIESFKNINTVEKSYSDGGAGFIQEKAKLDAIKSMYLDINTTIAKRKQLLEILGVPTNKVNSYTSEQLKSEDLINSAINDRLKLIKEEAVLRAKAQEYSRLLSEKERVETDIREIEIKYNGHKEFISKFDSIKLNNLENEKIQLEAAISFKSNDLEKSFKAVEKRRINDELKNNSGSATNDLDTLKKYAKERKELDNQLKNGAVSQQEYEEGVLKLTDSFLKQIGILDKVEGKYKDLFYALMQENLALQDIDIEIKDPEVKVDTDKFQQKLQKETSKDLYIPIRPEARDKTFDYKKSESQQLEEQLQIAQKLKEELQKAVESGLSNYKAELEVVIKGEKDLSKALKLAQVQEDIKAIQDQLNESTFSSIKDIATSVERLNDAFKNVKDTFNDIDASGFEKAMSVINALIQTIDSISSVAKGIESLTELTTKLTLAKEAENTIIATKAATEVAAIGSVTAAKATAAATEAPIVIGQIALAKAATAAFSGQMAAQSAAAYASIPFAGVALAAGQIAAMEAMIIAAGIPKFADGGIVSGATIGMIGEYAGASTNPEVIAPLDKLKSLLKLDSSTGSSEVTFKIKGDELVGVLNNHSRKKSKVK